MDSSVDAGIPRRGYQGNREGLAIYSRERGTGYIVSTDQIRGKSRYFLYRREGAPGKPQDHSEVVAIFEGSADSTDGLEVSSRALRPGFPEGFLVAMNSAPKNFLIFKWPSLCTRQSPFSSSLSQKQ